MSHREPQDGYSNRTLGVLFLEHFFITLPNAMSIYYLGTKTFKDKNVYLLLFIHLLISDILIT